MSLNGLAVTMTFGGPDMATILAGGLVTVGSGLEVTTYPNFTMDLEGDVFTMSSNPMGRVGFSEGAFIGFILTDSEGVLPEIGGITILQDHFSYDMSRTTFSADSIATNLQNLQSSQTGGIFQYRLELTPSDMALSANRLSENARGAIVGDITVTDLNDADTHEFSVDDARFRIADGQLKLRNGVSLDYETEPSIDVTVTATDSFGLRYREVFTIAVADGVERIRGRDGDDVIQGTADNDRINAQSGDDIVRGLGGDDVLRSVRGDDRFWGGPGADIFIYSSGSGTDRVMDFEDGIDRIDVRKWAAMDDFSTLKSHSRTIDGDLWITHGKDALVIEDFSKGQLDRTDVMM